MQYKNHLSGFRYWTYKDTCERWLLFPDNIGPCLSIDEVAISKGELYTIVTNKAGRGKKGSLVALIHGTAAGEIIRILRGIPCAQRCLVREVTLDMDRAMGQAVREVFPHADRVIDRFHVQKLVSEAVQEIRINERWQAIKEENEEVKRAQAEKRPYRPKLYRNGDSKKQLLARSRHLLFKSRSKWTYQQTERARILFREFPLLKQAYGLSMMFRACYEYSRTIPEAKQRLEGWYRKAEEKNIDSFRTAAETIRLHEPDILNYFINRSTNASAESFNAKLKGFRTVVRGVRDRKFHLFRIAKLYG